MLRKLLVSGAVAALIAGSGPAFAAHVGVPNDNANPNAGGQANAAGGLSNSAANGRVDNGFGNAGETGAGTTTGAGAEVDGTDADAGLGGNFGTPPRND
jgi:hypothetical protein